MWVTAKKDVWCLKILAALRNERLGILAGIDGIALCANHILISAAHFTATRQQSQNRAILACPGCRCVFTSHLEMDHDHDFSDRHRNQLGKLIDKLAECFGESIQNEGSMTVLNPRAQNVPKTKVERVKLVEITEARTRVFTAPTVCFQKKKH